jgi:ADP-ribose pyrophosphatase YjhB (NUDIX family)
MPHIHEKIDYAADVFIVHGNKVLLRKHDKYKMWLSPGGHVELNEDPTEAAIREVKEEVGLSISLAGMPKNYQDASDGKDLISPKFMNRHHVNATHEHISLVYFATADSTAIKQGESEISDEIRWFTRRELDDPEYGISERIRSHAKAALDELGD